MFSKLQKQSLRTALLATLLLIAACPSRSAVTLRIGSTLIISGTIEQRDVDRIDSIDFDGIRNIHVSGPGGNYKASLAISRTIHSRRSESNPRRLEVRDACLSACATLLAANGFDNLTVKPSGFLAFHGGLLGATFEMSEYLKAQLNAPQGSIEGIDRDLVERFIHSSEELDRELGSHFRSVGLDAEGMRLLLKIGRAEVLSMKLNLTPDGAFNIDAKMGKPLGCLWAVPDAAYLRRVGYRVRDFEIDKSSVSRRLGVDESQVCWLTSEN